MTKFFVYVGIDYYPFAETVEAESKTEAIDMAMKANEFYVKQGRFGCVAVELEKCAVTGDDYYWSPDLIQPLADD